MNGYRLVLTDNNATVVDILGMVDHVQCKQIKWN